MNGSPTLGTLLRHAIDLLDGAVEDAYRAADLPWRPRYTPVARALVELGPAPIRAIAGHAKVTHSAASQTLAHMVRAGLAELRPGNDGRERIAALTPAAVALLPALRRQWRATNAAADRLDAELSAPITAVLAEAIAALERRPFAARIDDARRDQPNEAP